MFEARKVTVGFLNSDQSALPRTKPKQHDREKNKRYPADGDFRPAGKISDGKNQHEGAKSDQRAAHRRADNIFLHKRLDLVEMMMLHLRVAAAEYVDLRRGNAGTLELLFKDFQVV